MTDETSEALEASITKWEGYIAAETPEAAELKDCPLCEVFNKPLSGHLWCSGCPVKEKTGKRICNGTPYYDAAYAWEIWNLYGEDEARDKFRTNARAEVEFLKTCRKEKRDA